MLQILTLWMCGLFGAAALCVLGAVTLISVRNRLEEKRETCRMADAGYVSLAEEHEADHTAWITEYLQADIVVQPGMIVKAPRRFDDEELHWAAFSDEVHTGASAACVMCSETAGDRTYPDITDTDVIAKITEEREPPFVLQVWGMDASALTDLIYQRALQPALPGKTC